MCGGSAERMRFTCGEHPWAAAVSHKRAAHSVNEGIRLDTCSNILNSSSSPTRRCCPVSVWSAGFRAEGTTLLWCHPSSLRCGTPQRTGT